MSGLLSLEVGSVIACLAVFCCMAGFIHTMHARHTPSPPLAPHESAAVVCAACLGGLSGLESHCPTCGRRLRYQVPEAISPSASPHTRAGHTSRQTISIKEE
jgi:rRNA maturation protein Nop10